MGELGCNVKSFMDCSKRNKIKNMMLDNFQCLLLSYLLLVL